MASRSIPMPRAIGTGADETAPGIQVLLIEDNRGFAYFVRDLLMRKHCGQFTLEETSTLAGGLDHLRRRPFDVVLLDLGLPDSVRIETFARLNAQSPDTPIVILTVLDDDEVAREAVGAGAQDYLIKDQVDDNLLLRSIRYAIERGRGRKALLDLSARILQLQDEERRRIARELHDTTAQDLAALAMNLALLQEQHAALTPRAQAALKDSLICADRCVRGLRTMSYLLHPPLLDEVGLAGAVREYADSFAERSGIRVDLELSRDFGRFAKPTETALFRVMQECLTNILRHSGSATASIRLEQGKSEILMEIRDSGRGISPERLTEVRGDAAGLGVGIRGMFERIQQLRGVMEILAETTGTTVRVTLPATEATA
jgi:signal transduction histidine kinase